MRERAARELAQLVSIAPERAGLALVRRVPVEQEQAGQEQALALREGVELEPAGQEQVLALRERFELEPAELEQVLALREVFELEPELRKPEQASLARD